VHVWGLSSIVYRSCQVGVCGQRDGHADGLIVTLHRARIPARVAGPGRLGNSGGRGPSRTMANSKMQMLVFMMS
jgi:hypothetical protein